MFEPKKLFMPENAESIQNVRVLSVKSIIVYKEIFKRRGKERGARPSLGWQQHEGEDACQCGSK
jgi:hypothetical protein